jgi:DNA-binding MarR family transcriptional regulator
MDRIALETSIVNKAVDILLKQGFKIRVHDGEDFCHDWTTDPTTIQEALFSTDEDRLYATRDPEIKNNKATEERVTGWLRFIYGNCGYDVLNDYTMNMAPYISELEAHITKLEDRYA